MKVATLFFMIIIAIAKLYGQGYYEITFTGTGAIPDTILVENLTKGTSVSMQSADVLHLDLVVSVREIGRVNRKLNIYPNPMDHTCHFEFLNAKHGTIDIQLYATDGRLLHSSSRELSQGKHSFMLSGVSAGVYILNIQTQSDHFSGHFVSTGPPKAVFSLVQTKDLPLPKTEEINSKDGFSLNILNTKGTKAIVNMDFTIGDQLRFIGSATSFPNDTVYSSPTGNQTIHFDFVGLPTITTDSVTYITYTAAISGGKITNDGGASVTARGVCWDTTANPVVTGNHTTDGTGTGAFTSSITGLYSNTIYYVRAYATNSAGTAYGNQLSFMTPAFSCGDTLTDTRDGQQYPTVQIGTQCWMAKNLNIGAMVTDHFSGNLHTHCSNNGIIEKYCYNNDPANCAIYGGLYDWNEMMGYVTTSGVQGICPTGWHIPTDAEWCTLTTFLDATVNCNTWGYSGTNAGGKMKATGTTHWYSSNTGVTNSSGFTALGAGYRSYYGNFYFLSYNAYFWSSSETSSTSGISRYLHCYYATVGRYDYYKTYGFSVRCLRN